MAIVTNLRDIVAASKDLDLLERVAAAAAEAGIASPEMWARQYASQIAAQVIDDDSGGTLASTYAYAAASVIPPGLNPAAVTDPQIRRAVSQVNTAAG